MSTTRANAVVERFLEAFSRRDFEGLAATFVEDGRLRALVPSTLRECEGRAEIAERFAVWNGDEDWELLDAETEDLADLVRFRWRVASTDPELGPAVYEQTAYADIGDDGIRSMNLVCSGARAAV